MSLQLNGIAIWHGSINEIPSGWSLCDGNNGTPDLRNKFVVGAGDTYSFESTGGFADAVVVTHGHTLSGTTTSNAMGTHTHVSNFNVYSTGNLPTLAPLRSNTTSGGGTSAGGSHSHAVVLNTAGSGENGVGKNLPPYYSLAFIMQTV